MGLKYFNQDQRERIRKNKCYRPPGPVGYLPHTIARLHFQHFDFTLKTKNPILNNHWDGMKDSDGSVKVFWEFQIFYSVGEFECAHGFFFRRTMLRLSSGICG